MKAARIQKRFGKLISYGALILASLLLGSLNQAVRGALIPSKEGTQTLVLVDDWATLETHSVFFESLRRDGHNLVFESANPPPQIKYYDQFYYDNIIMMAPSVKGRCATG